MRVKIGDYFFSEVRINKYEILKEESLISCLVYLPIVDLEMMKVSVLCFPELLQVQCLFRVIYI